MIRNRSDWWLCIKNGFKIQKQIRFFSLSWFCVGEQLMGALCLIPIEHMWLLNEITAFVFVHKAHFICNKSWESFKHKKNKLPFAWAEMTICLCSLLTVSHSIRLSMHSNDAQFAVVCRIFTIKNVYVPKMSLISENWNSNQNERQQRPKPIIKPNYSDPNAIHDHDLRSTGFVQHGLNSSEYSTQNL